MVIELIVFSYLSKRPIGMARATTMKVFNKVETKDLCTVRYSSTSNKDLLFCGFEAYRASRPSYFDRPQRIDHGVENELARLLCSLTFDELQMN
jgi:hypothetical protein